MLPRIKYIVVVLGLFTSSFLHGQTFKAGVLAGLSTSQVGGDGYSGFNKAGINAGFFANSSIGKEVDLQFELEYIQKGSRKNPNTDKGDFSKLLLRLDYVQIPVLIKYHQKSFYLEGGGYAGILVNFYLEDESGVRTSDFENNVFINDVKNTDFGMLVGIGYNVTDHIILNSRFLQTVGNVKEFESGAVRWLKSGWSNSVISFTFRYEFGQKS